MLRTVGEEKRKKHSEESTGKHKLSNTDEIRRYSVMLNVDVGEYDGDGS
jgi:anaerobic ribonucleoside-triphosphate reductase